MMDTKYLREHKRLALGMELDMGETFGVAPLSSHMGNGSSGKTDGGTLADHKRGAGLPVEGSQANPDHGPHS